MRWDLGAGNRRRGAGHREFASLEQSKLRQVLGTHSELTSGELRNLVLEFLDQRFEVDHRGVV
jgi:hypothetical protein